MYLLTYVGVLLTLRGCALVQLRMAELNSAGGENRVIVERLNSTERELELAQHECTQLQV